MHVAHLNQLNKVVWRSGWETINPKHKAKSLGMIISEDINLTDEVENINKQ